MGLGDELMATGFARDLWSKNHGRQKVRIGRSLARPERSPMFENLGFLDQEGLDTSNLILCKNHSGSRHYIDKDRVTQTCRFPLRKDAHAKRGHYERTREEYAWAVAFLKGDRPRVAVCTHAKETSVGPNKTWPLEHWCELVVLLTMEGYRAIQVAPPGSPRIPGAQHCMDANVRNACAVVLGCEVAVTTEGLFSHLLGVEWYEEQVGEKAAAVVIWGERADPRRLGYPEHVNMVRRSPRGFCEQSAPCDHCQRAMREIGPREVLENVKWQVAMRRDR